MIIAIVILIILLVPVVAATFMSDEYEIKAGTDINRSKQDVFNYVKYISNAEQFNKWMMKDPHLRKELVGTDGTVGFVYKWDSDNKNVGQGEQEITRIEGNDRIEFELRFIRPFANVCDSAIVVTSIDAQRSQLTWSFSGRRNFAMRIFHFVFNLKNMLLKDMRENVNNIKRNLE